MKYAFALLLLFPSVAWAQSPPAQPASPDAKVKYGSECPYPEAARRAGVQGETGVTFQVADDGAIKDVTLAVSSGNNDLDEATIRCVGNWRVSQERQAPELGKMPRAMISWTIPASAPQSAMGRLMPGWPHSCAAYNPPEEFRAGIGGVTTVSFDIKTNGNVSNVEVAQSSGNAQLDKAAVICVNFWHYIPAVRNGEPVRVPWEAKVVWTTPAPSIPPKAGP